MPNIETNYENRYTLILAFIVNHPVYMIRENLFILTCAIKACSLLKELNWYTIFEMFDWHLQKKKLRFSQ